MSQNKSAQIKLANSIKSEKKKSLFDDLFAQDPIKPKTTTPPKKKDTAQTKATQKPTVTQKDNKAKSATTTPNNTSKDKTNNKTPPATSPKQPTKTTNIKETKNNNTDKKNEVKSVSTPPPTTSLAIINKAASNTIKPSINTPLKTIEKANTAKPAINTTTPINNTKRAIEQDESIQADDRPQKKIKTDTTTIAPTTSKTTQNKITPTPQPITSIIPQTKVTPNPIPTIQNKVTSKPTISKTIITTNLKVAPKVIIKKTASSNGKNIIVDTKSLFKSIVGNLNNNNNNNESKLVSEPITSNDNSTNELVLELKTKAENNLNIELKPKQIEKEIDDQVLDFLINFSNYYKSKEGDNSNNSIIDAATNSSKKKKGKTTTTTTTTNEENNKLILNEFKSTIDQTLKSVTIDIEFKNEFIMLTKAALRYSKVQKKFISLKYIQIAKKKIKQLFKSIEILKQLIDKIIPFLNSNNNQLPSKQFIEQLIKTINQYANKPIEMAIFVMIEAGNINCGILGFGHFAKFIMIAMGSLSKLHSFIKQLKLNLNNNISNLYKISNKL